MFKAALQMPLSFCRTLSLAGDAITNCILFQAALQMPLSGESGNTKPNIEAATTLAKALDASLDVLTGLNQYASNDIDKLTALAKKLNPANLKAILNIMDALTAKPQ